MTTVPGDSDFILIEDRLPAVILTLNRAAQRNALSTGLMRALRNALRAQYGREACRVIILRAAGPVFSAGHDLRELVCRTEEEQRAIFDLCSELMLSVQQAPQPVIASVHGLATAAGCQLVASCDLVVAAEQAKFATPGVKIGLFCSTPAVALVRAIGRKRAMEMLLTGAPINAATAAAWGLVNRVVLAERLDDEVMALANQIASASRQTVRIGKEAFYRQVEAGIEDAYCMMSETMAANAVTDDAQEGIAAFLEERTPRWTGA